jgi:hypothetical protein
MVKGQILATEFSEIFVQGMRERMMVSYYKYGPVADAYPHKVNALESLQKRIDKYIETGNTEFLMDAANFAMIEFMFPSHPSAHFRPTDSNESPGRAAYDTGFEPTQKENKELSDEEWKSLRENMEVK